MTASRRLWRLAALAVAVAGTPGVSSAAELNPAAVTYKLPDQIPWGPVNAAGAQQAVVENCMAAAPSKSPAASVGRYFI